MNRALTEKSSPPCTRLGAAHGRSVAVIGAGPGGLAAAVQLAAAGAFVTVYEAQPLIGGRSRRLTVGDYAFDCGPTFFMMPWVLEEIFAACGATLADRVQLTRLDPMYRLVLERRGAEPIVLDTTQDLARMRERLAAIEPTDAAAFDRFMRETREKLRRLTPVLRRPIRSWFDLMNLEGLRAATVLRPWRSVADELARRFTHPQIRLALSFQSKYLGMSPLECPELFTILPFIEYEYGIWHPRGGCNALLSALATLAEDMGVIIRTGAPVDRLLFDGHRARGVVVHGAEVQHDHVVINADASWALKNLIPESLRLAAARSKAGRGAPGLESDAAIESRDYSCSTFMLYLGIRGELPLPHHSISTSAEYERNLEDITHRGVLSTDPSMYVCNPSRTDPTLAPRGHSSLYVLVPVPNTKTGSSTIDWTRDAPQLRERVFDQLDRVHGLGDLRGRIEAEHMVTPQQWREERITHGATFNLAHSFGQMLHRRPHHRLPGFDGVWFVGGGTHPGSGLPVIFLSSTITTRLLCGELGLTHPMDAPDAPAKRYPRISDAHLRQLSEDPGASLASVPLVEAGGTR